MSGEELGTTAIASRGRATRQPPHDSGEVKVAAVELMVMRPKAVAPSQEDLGPLHGASQRGDNRGCGWACF